MTLIEEKVSELEKLLKDLVYAQFKTEQKIAQLSDEMKAYKDFTEATIKELNKKWGELANRLGTIVEDLIAPNLPNALEKFFNLKDYDFFAIRVKRKSKELGLEKEIDALLVFKEKKTVVINETKATATIQGIEEFGSFLKSGNFFKLFPEYKNYTILPIFSSIYMEPKLIEKLTSLQIFAVLIEGDILHFKNYEKLKNKYNITSQG